MKKQLLSMGALILAGVFMPTSMLLVIGMLPTVVAGIVDRTPERLKAMTVGCLNFAATFPFLIELGTRGHTIDIAMQIIANPRNIIVMYTGALCGYVLEIFLSRSIAKLAVQQARQRLKKLKAEQDKLIARWGIEVTGTIPLDPQGFPLEEDKEAKKQ